MPRRKIEDVGAEFLINVGCTGAAVNEMSDASGNIRGLLDEITLALTGRTQDEALAQETEEYENRHAHWKFGQQFTRSIHPDFPAPADEPEPQPPTDVQAVPPLSFDADVRAEMFGYIEAIEKALDHVDAATEELKKAVEEFSVAVGA